MGKQCSRLRWRGGERTGHLGVPNAGNARKFLERSQKLSHWRCARATEETQVGDRMHLTPREQERLLIYVAADVARKRRARGLKLNYPEAIAILTAEILEWARDGKSVAEIMTLGTKIL